MEKCKLLPVIAAIMITSIAASMLLISTPVAVAEHSAEASITVEGLTKVRPEVRKVFKLTVTHKSGEKIDKVTMYDVPAKFENFGMVYVLGKDNLVELRTSAAGENIIALKKDTVVQVYYDGQNRGACLPANTILTRDSGENLLVVYEGAWRVARLTADAQIKIATADYTFDNLLDGDNLKLTKITRVENTFENRYKVIADTDVENIAVTRSRVIENTDVYKYPGDLITARENVSSIENLVLLARKRVTLLWDNLENSNAEVVNDATANIYNIDNSLYQSGVNIKTRRVALPGSMAAWGFGGTTGFAGETVSENTVYIPADTIIRPRSDIPLRVRENTIVIVEAGGNLENGVLKAKTEGWVADATLRRWTTTDATKMISGGSKDFYFVATASAQTTESSHKFIVRTQDNVGENCNPEVTFVVDGLVPYSVITPAKTWAKSGESVTITVVFNEEVKLASGVVGWLSLKENIELPQTITMISTDNKTWEGTYTVGDNALRDGTAAIRVVADNITDVVGNKPSADNLCYVLRLDRRPPPTPTRNVDNVGINYLVYDVTDLITEAPGIQTNQASMVIKGKVIDNRYDPNLVGTAGRHYRENIEGMTVKLRGVTPDLVSDSAGGYIKSITLTEGMNTLGVKFVDLAGNESPENVENVFYDRTKPTADTFTIAGKNYVDNMAIKDNRPTIAMRIYDPGYAAGTGYGVDNRLYALGSHHGYRVELRYDNRDSIAVLGPDQNVKAWDKATGEFENTRPTALAEGWYRVEIVAGDNLQSMDNKVLRFRIDVTAPSAPGITTTIYPTATKEVPKVLTEKTLSIVGGREDKNATLKVWISTDGLLWTDVTTKATITYPTDTTWNMSYTPDPGISTLVAVTQVDEAGWESPRQLFGWIKTDATAPVISALTVNEVAYTAKVTTDKSSVIIAGKVSDDVSKFNAIRLRLSYAGVSTYLDLTQGATEHEGIFSKSVPLAEDTNTFTLVANDEAGNVSSAFTLQVERTVAPTTTYAIIIVIVALILAAIAIFVKK